LKWQESKWLSRISLTEVAEQEKYRSLSSKEFGERQVFSWLLDFEAIDNIQCREYRRKVNVNFDLLLVRAKKTGPEGPVFKFHDLKLLEVDGKVDCSTCIVYINVKI
jgi:hypothetical protein